MTCYPFPILEITDGTTRVDLIGRNFCIEDWIPSIPGPKGGGVWQSSPLSDGRQLADWLWDNWIDTFTIHISSSDNQDDTILALQELHRLLVKAVQYWTTDWQNEPVWIKAKATYETNTRYAIIKGWLTPQASNPFGPVFVESAVIDSFQLTLEHTAWQSTEPGTGDCVEISGYQEWCVIYHLEFDGVASEVNCGSDAGLDTLPTDRAPYDGFTAEAWIRPDSYGGSDSSYIFSKYNGAAIGWFLTLNFANGLIFEAQYGVQDSLARSGLDDISADGEWHHVAVTFIDNPLVLMPRLWVDGREVSYTAQQGGTGGYNFGESNLDLYIGNGLGGANGFDGDIGWCRISNNQRYTDNFDPPDRCELPAIDADTIAQWIGPERSGATIDNQEGTAARDGTQTDCDFDCDCDNVFGRTATCEEEVYVANKHNVAQLTDIYVDNGGAFGPNLIVLGVLPYNLLPAVPVANDAVYFGIDTSLDDTGPFCSLVFDIATAVTGVTGSVWEYWNGAWTAFLPGGPIQDNTDDDGAMTGVAFNTVGVRSVHWEPQADWVAVDLSTAAAGAPAVTGFWVRLRVTIAAGATAPIQQNRNPYTILWPYITIDADAIGGDISALIRLMFRNQSDTIGGALLSAWSNRVIVGLRSLSRGEDFTPYLNLADEQNNANITVSTYVAAAFANDITASSGRCIDDTPAAVLSQAALVRMSGSLVPQYTGTFRVFVRAQQLTGVVGNIGLQFRAYYSTNEQLMISETIYFESLNSWQIFDFGLLTIPSQGPDDQSNFISLWIYSIGNASDTCRYYEIILMPVDEWAIDAIDTNNGARTYNGDRSAVDDSYLLHIDSLTYPKQFRTLIREYSTLYITNRWLSITPQPAVIQANADQRLWFLSTRYSVIGGSTNQRSEPFVAHNASLIASQRYLLMRGGR
jgi:hypothetical protein